MAMTCGKPRFALLMLCGLQEIAETKLPDLNCTKIEAAMKVIAGTARNMGIKIKEPEEVAS